MNSKHNHFNWYDHGLNTNQIDWLNNNKQNKVEPWVGILFSRRRFWVGIIDEWQLVTKKHFTISTAIMYLTRWKYGDENKKVNKQKKKELLLHTLTMTDICILIAKY